MEYHDVIVVGGGPAGAACARRLTAAGRRAAVLDRETFPRTKLCAGWVTPEVLATLELDPAEYPHGMVTFDHLVIHVRGLSFDLPTVQHSIRRYEFDDFLLRSSGAAIIRHQAREVRRHDEYYEIDGRFRARYLVGAGGTRCPVYRSLFRDANPRAKDRQIVAYEQEFPYQWRDPRCHLWFFDDGLPGYSWYVPKAGGWLNCGIGAMADRLKERGRDIVDYWERFAGMLQQKELVRNVDFSPRGYSYYVRGGVDVCRIDRAFIAGDAAGLATVDLGEGIGPAVKSGCAAATAIIEDADYTLDAVEMTSADRVVRGDWLRRLVRAGLDWKFPARAAGGA